MYNELKNVAPNIVDILKEDQWKHFKSLAKSCCSKDVGIISFYSNAIMEEEKQFKNLIGKQRDIIRNLKRTSSCLLKAMKDFNNNIMQFIPEDQRLKFDNEPEKGLGWTEYDENLYNEEEQLLKDGKLKGEKLYYHLAKGLVKEKNYGRLCIDNGGTDAIFGLTLEDINFLFKNNCFYPLNDPDEPKSKIKDILKFINDNKIEATFDIGMPTEGTKKFYILQIHYKNKDYSDEIFEKFGI